MADIELAFEGRSDMLQAIFGGGKTEADKPVADVAEGLKAGLRSMMKAKG